MPWFEVLGIGRDTGRRRKSCYEAADEEQAIHMAADDGTVVEAVKPIPDLGRPTERQLAYARSIGPEISPDITREEISDLLTSHQEGDPTAGRHLQDSARALAVPFTAYIGAGDLRQRIVRALSAEERWEELARWFAYCVACDLLSQEEVAKLGGLEGQLMRDLAANLSGDPSVMKSIRRYDGRDLAFFGEQVGKDGWSRTGGSKRTIAYKQAVQELRQRVPRLPAARSTHGRAARRQKQSGSSGCLGGLALGVALAVLAFVWQSALR